ncbi:unnamed protein product [Soboliphyme baturini]|uniref:Uncharacterized protein n=1 Tax=Soboliphyme baturini TaxID=241478 RepID=A0A183IZ15_9BILA|nr:unnamed protein product [Soboliphyme baturini]
MAVAVEENVDQTSREPKSPSPGDVGSRPKVPAVSATTTISTIAIKAGDTSRLVLAVLKCGDVTEIRVDKMEPSLLDIGDGYDMALQRQQEHVNLMEKLEEAHRMIMQFVLLTFGRIGMIASNFAVTVTPPLIHIERRNGIFEPRNK